MSDGGTGQNVFPDADNYPDSSFPQPVPPPSVDPDDEGTLISVQYSWHWREVLMAAVDQLLNPATWDGDHDEIILALNRAANLKIQLNTDVPTRNLAPYWQDETDIEGEVPPDETQNWWGVFDGLTFQASLENAFIAQFVGILAGFDAAVEFLFLARRFRLEFESDPYGGIVDILVNSDRYASIDTYAPSPGIVGVDILMPPETLTSADTLLLVLTDETNEEALGDSETTVMRVVRKRLIASEVSPDNTRWLSPDDGGGDEGTAQETYDDGETWVDKPGIDPRHNPATFQFPPRTGGDPKCDAVANMVAALHTVIDIVLAAPSVIASVNTLLNYVKRFIPEIGFIIEILHYIADILNTLKPYLEASFTTETYDGIQCVLFCHVEDDGTITADELGAAIGDICDQFDDTVCAVCQAVFQTWWGEVGTTNAGTIGSATGDCDECACNWCYEFDFTASNYAVTAVAGFTGCTYVEGQGFTNTGVYGYSRMNLDLDWYATRIEVDLTLSATADAGNTCFFSADAGGGIYLWSSATGSGGAGGCESPSAGTSGTMNYLANSGSPFAGHDVRMNPTNQYSGGTVTIHRIRFHGAGTCPFGEPNC